MRRLEAVRHPTPTQAGAGIGPAGGGLVNVSTSGFAGGGAGVDDYVDGTLTDESWFSAEVVDGTKFIDFDFGSTKVVDEIKFYQSSSETHGVWHVYIWDGDSYEPIGSDFTLGGATVQTITAISGNTTASQFYRLVGVSGNTDGDPYVREFEFKIGL